MSKIRTLSVRRLLLTAAFAFPLAIPATAQETEPRDKPVELEHPAPAEEKAPPEKKPEAEEPEPAKPAAPPEKEPAPPEEPPAPPPPMEEPEAKPEEKAPAEKEPEAAKPEPAKPAAPPEKPVAEPEAAEKPPADQLDKEAVKAVVDMSERLAKLKSFAVEADMAWEEVLENGEKLISIEQVQADVVRPYHLRMERSSPGRDRIFFYNGSEAVLWGPVTRYYTTTEFSGKLAELAVHLAEKYGYEIPLADLFMWGHDEEQIKAIKAANFIGQDRIGERICDHYAYRQENVDWQIWIDTEEGGLPCAYAIVDLSDPARPTFRATVEIDPEATFDDKRFTFDKPEDAAEIPLATIEAERKAKEEKQEEQKPAPEPEEKPAPAPKEEGKEEPKPEPEQKEEPEAEKKPEQKQEPEPEKEPEPKQEPEPQPEPEPRPEPDQQPEPEQKQDRE